MSQKDTLLKHRQIFSTLLASLPLFARSEVDLFTGAFLQDSPDPLFPPQLKSRRNYSSRSLHQGIYGFGWCSEFEKKIQLETDKLTLFNCKTESPLVFIPNPKNPTVFSHSNQSLKKVGSYFLHFINNQLKATFDDRGRLQSWHGSDRIIFFEYDGAGLLKDIRWDKKTKLKIEWDQDFKKIKSIKSQTGSQVDLTYKEGDLIKVTDRNSNRSEDYSYDTNHNLIATASEAVRYNSEQDTVSEITTTACTETYSYAAAGLEAQKTIVTRHCADRPEENRSFLFRLKTKFNTSTGVPALTIQQIEVLENQRTKTYSFESHHKSQISKFKSTATDRRRTAGGLNE